MASRIFFSSHQAGLAQDGSTTFTAIHGLQSVSSSANFNLVQYFELGQLAIYENKETIPTVEFTFNKALDGYPLVYCLASQDAVEPTLVARSATKCLASIGIFSDTAESATGTPTSQLQASGLFVNSLSYNFSVDDTFTETVGMVGNDRVWANDEENIAAAPWANAKSLTFTGAFSALDSPIGSGGVNRRENLLMIPDPGIVTLDVNGMIADPDCTILPPDVFGVSASGVNTRTGNDFAAHIQSISISTDLTREEINELGRRGPYSRTVTFPIEVTCEITVVSTSGDMVSATENGIRNLSPTNNCVTAANLQDRTIRVATCEGTRIYLGTKNKLASVSYSGGDATGGNVTVSYGYSSFNTMVVMHSGDPNGNFAFSGRSTYLLDI